MMYQIGIFWLIIYLIPIAMATWVIATVKRIEKRIDSRFTEFEQRLLNRS